MNGCIYRTKDNECDLYSEGGRFKAICDQPEKCQGRKMSNYDRLISKTPEELAEWLATIIDCGACKIYSYKDGCMASEEACVCQWLDWLQDEFKGEEMKGCQKT